MKNCFKCKTHKDVSLFTTNKEAKDGLHSWCRECVNAHRSKRKNKYKIRAKQYRIENAKKIREKKREYYSTQRGKLLKSIMDKKYREKYKLILIKKRKALRQNHPEIIKKWKKNDYEKNRHKYMEASYRRYYKRKDLTPKDADMQIIKSIYKKAQTLTLQTGIAHEVDHVIPLSRGGFHHQNNLQILTIYENRSKGNKLLPHEMSGTKNNYVENS